MCVIGYLDVVFEGEGWSVLFYEGVVKDGKIFGCGVVDDKGLIVVVFYGMYVVKKFVEEKKIFFKRKLRFVFGINEEGGFKCF